MILNWKSEARGRRQRLDLTPYLHMWVDKVSMSNPNDERYSVFIFGTLFEARCVSDAAARNWAETQARHILSEGLAKLGEAE